MSLPFPLPISDSYSYQSYQRQRQLTLGDLLLENRIVFLQGEIYTGNANEVVMKLLYLQSENRRKDIHFYINSPGGSVSATLAIYDTMQILTCPVATYCVGLAASGGAVLLAGGVLLLVLQRRMTPRVVGNMLSATAALLGVRPNTWMVPVNRGGFVEVTVRRLEVTTVQRPSPVRPAAPGSRRRAVTPHPAA